MRRLYLPRQPSREGQPQYISNMAITNTEFKQLQDYTFDEIGSFSVEQLAGVPMDAQFSPVTNATKVSHEETWDSNTSTWATETRTWDDMGSKVTNVALKGLGDYTVAEVGTFSVDQLADVSFDRQFSPVTNISKPS